MATEAPPVVKLFKECSIAILQGKDLSLKTVDLLEKMILGEGGAIMRIQPGGMIDLPEVTHIVSETIDFPQYTDARDMMIPVVKPSWLQESNRKNKLAQIKQHTPDPRLFFSGVNFAIADGIPEQDRYAIIGAAMSMGGQYTPGLTRLITHLVALSESDDMCVLAKEKRLKCKIVLPHWFNDCFQIGARIDDKPYLFPRPEISNVKPEGHLDIPDTPQLEGASDATPPAPAMLKTRKLKVFRDKKIMLSEDLEMPQSLWKVLKGLLQSNGGTLVNSVYDTDIFVCSYRDGDDYLVASRTDKDVGNLAWLYFLITHDEWTSPFKRLLHYPVPRNGIKGFQDFRITLSNYGGEARVYLENLIRAAGATFTKSMKQDNTHLITARKSSEKCDAALEWGVEMANHLWLEESYAKSEIQALTRPQYTHYPPRTNLGEVIGRTPFDKTTLEKKFYPEELLNPKDRKRINAMKELPNDRASKTPASKTPAAKKTSSGSIGTFFDGAESFDNSETPVTSSAASRKRTSLFTPASNRLTNKENNTPSSTGSRRAKDNALSRLHDLAPDIALYEKEKKRTSGIWGGKQAADRSEKEMEAGRKRTSTSPLATDDNEDSSMEPDAKRRKASSLPDIKIRLLHTGYKRWVESSEHAQKEVAEIKKLRNLGILIVKDPTACSHMAAPQVVKTEKFLTALAYAPVIISTDFIDACIEKNKVPKVDDFLLEDKNSDIKLRDSLARAKINRRHLLSGVAIYCTNKINNGPAAYKKIVEVNGGTFVEYNPRHPNIRKPTAESQDKEEREPVYLLSSLNPEEKKIWPKFKDMANRGLMEPRIVSTDWLLASALSQQLKWDDKYLLEGLQ